MKPQVAAFREKEESVEVREEFRSPRVGAPQKIKFSNNLADRDPKIMWVA